MRYSKSVLLLVIITLTNTQCLFAAGKKLPEIKLPLISGMSKMKKARVKATFDKRRLIFNDDTHGMGMFVVDTKEKFLSRRMKPLLGTQTTTVSWSVLGGWADAPMYDSKIQPVYGDAQGGVPPYYPKFTSNLKALIKAGHCPLQMVIDFTHENGMETFAHVRMNDCHDSFIGGGRTIWKRTHPELLVDTKGVLPHMQLYTSAQDFTHEEVRRRKFEIIKEVCTRYDIDGFELDFIRHPAFFSRTLRGLPTTKEQIEIMTSLMHKIRKLTDRVAAKRNRPLLIAIRIPDTFEQSLDIGLDVVKWMQDDLFDILIPSGYSPFTVDIKQLAEQAHKYDVAIYPCNNYASVAHPSKENFLQLSRAAASNWYMAGADGIHTFNVGTAFDSKTGEELIKLQKKQYAFLYEVGNPDTLLRKDKLFAVDPEKERALVYYKHVSTMSPLPIFTKTGACFTGTIQRLPILIGDDFTQARQKDFDAKLKMNIKLRGTATKKMLMFEINGQPLQNAEFITCDDKNKEYQLNYPIDPKYIKRGKNIITVLFNYSQKRPETPVEIYNVTLKVKYTKTS